MSDEIRLKPVSEVVKAGEGAQGTALSVHNGMVIIHFERMCEWAALDPDAARRFAEEMAKKSFEARFGRAPSHAESQSYIAQDMRKRITNVMREKMVNRTVMLLRNFAEKKPALGYQAEQIVDHVLKEVA